MQNNPYRSREDAALNTQSEDEDLQADREQCGTYVSSSARQDGCQGIPLASETGPNGAYGPHRAWPPGLVSPGGSSGRDWTSSFGSRSPGQIGLIYTLLCIQTEYICIQSAQDSWA